MKFWERISKTLQNVFSVCVYGWIKLIKKVQKRKSLFYQLSKPFIRLKSKMTGGSRCCLE